MRLLYRPIGLLFSVVGGLAASAIFKRVWRAVAHEGEAPSPTDASRGWGEIVIAAALEGAVFGAVKAIADRGERPGSLGLRVRGLGEPGRRTSRASVADGLGGVMTRFESDGPIPVTRRSWRSVLSRSVSQFRADNITDLAAALTYYGLLAVFPGLLVLVSVLGLLGPSATNSLLDNIGQITPGGVRSFFETVVENAQRQRATASIAAIAGLGLAFWSASSYIGAFMRASNAIYGVGEGRPIWKTAPIRLAVTAAVVLMLAVSAAIVVLTGRIAEQVGQMLGIGATAVTVWDIGKWPVLLLIVTLILAMLYRACPNVQQPGFRWVTPGSALAVLIWLIASGGFAVYVANFASYNKTYGSIAGIIVFLVWLWITNIAVLLGVEVNAELEHQRAIAAGLPQDEEFAVPRDTRKLNTAETERAEELSRRRQI